MDYTIEQRAEQANPNDYHGDLYEKGLYYGFNDGYEAGATDQRKIDIDKACEILRSMFKFKWTNHENEYFRKAMEE